MKFSFRNGLSFMYIQVIYEGLVGNGSLNHIALDDIELYGKYNFSELVSTICDGKV